MKGIIIAAVVAVLLLGVFNLPSGDTTIGDSVLDTVTASGYDATDLPRYGDPDRPFAQQVRNERRIANRQITRASKTEVKNPLSKGGTDPEEWTRRKIEAAEKVAAFRQGEDAIDAARRGALRTESNTMDPRHLWTRTHEELHVPARITVRGEATPNAAGNDALGKYKGPLGWEDNEIPSWYFTRPYQTFRGPRRLCPQYPYMAVIGRVEQGQDKFSCEGTFLVGGQVYADPKTWGRGPISLGINEVVFNQWGYSYVGELNNNGGQFSYVIEPIKR
jgi:hypothetical protein